MLKTPVIYWMVLVATSAVSMPAYAEDRGKNVCRASTYKIVNSCRLNAREERLQNESTCLNLSDRGERRTCFGSARGAYTEALDDCGSQREARVALCRDFGGGAYDPEINPADFLSPAEAAANPNPYLKLVPGLVLRYQVGSETTVVTVTNRTRVIDGITTTVVTDEVRNGSLLVEDTEDYFAQDKNGAVWYFGELVKNFDQDGNLEDLDGSFISGVNGAKPGIAMQAAPQVGQKYRQEFALAEAEDVAEVISLTGNESAPAAACNGACVVIEETNPLEPDARAFKYYVAGIGFVLETDADSGARADELVEIINP